MFTASDKQCLPVSNILPSIPEQSPPLPHTHSPMAGLVIADTAAFCHSLLILHSLSLSPSKAKSGSVLPDELAMCAEYCLDRIRGKQPSC